MSKVDLDWANIGFAYHKTPYRYSAKFVNGEWQEGKLITEDTITLSECACVFQYAQTCFEGLKAYYTEDGKIVCFRPDLNAQRMYDTAKRLVMPPYPVDKFIEAVKMVVKANKDFVPPYGSGA